MMQFAEEGSPTGVILDFIDGLACDGIIQDLTMEPSEDDVFANTHTILHGIPSWALVVVGAGAALAAARLAADIRDGSYRVVTREQAALVWLPADEDDEPADTVFYVWRHGAPPTAQEIVAIHAEVQEALHDAVGMLLFIVENQDAVLTTATRLTVECNPVQLNGGTVACRLDVAPA